MHSRSDQVSKQLVRAVLQDGGSFTSEFEISPDPQNADGYFVPNPHAKPPVAGTLLGRMTKRSCSFEFFSTTPDTNDIGECVRKHLNLRHIVRKKQERQEKQEKQEAAALPNQWIISSGKPSSAIDACGGFAADAWPRGIYRLPSVLATLIVVVSELAEVRSTLLLRLMGRGRTLRRAVADLKALSENDFERCIALPILVRFRFDAEAEPISPVDKEFLMNTQEAFEMFQRQTELQGELRGELKGELRGELKGELKGALKGSRNMVLHQLRRKFGELPEAVICRVQAADASTLEEFADKLLFANSLEEVVADVR